MRMDGAGLVENIFTKTLRMLANPYKYPKNVAIDFHPHCRILKNALRMLMPLQIMRTPCKHLIRMKRLRSECLPNCFHLSLIRKQYSKQCQCKSKSPAMPRGMEKNIT